MLRVIYTGYVLSVCSTFLFLALVLIACFTYRNTFLISYFSLFPLEQCPSGLIIKVGISVVDVEFGSPWHARNASVDEQEKQTCMVVVNHREPVGSVLTTTWPNDVK